MNSPWGEAGPQAPAPSEAIRAALGLKDGPRSAPPAEPQARLPWSWATSSLRGGCPREGRDGNGVGVYPQGKGKRAGEGEGKVGGRRLVGPARMCGPQRFLESMRSPSQAACAGGGLRWRRRDRNGAWGGARSAMRGVFYTCLLFIFLVSPLLSRTLSFYNSKKNSIKTFLILPTQVQQLPTQGQCC